MKILLKLSFVIMLFSFGCNQKSKNKNGLLSNLGDITKNEDKGIKEIIAFYGGQCEYGVTKNIYSGKENETDFWLKFSKSQTIDGASNIAELSCSNIAYIFYKNLDKEKESYAHIQSELIFGNGENMKRNYTISELEKVKSKISVVNKIVELLKSKD